MSYTIQKQTSQILVSIQDELTIAQVRGLWDELLAAVSDPLPVVVDARNARRIDLSIVQVLHAISKSLGKLTVQDCSAQVRDYLVRAGVSLDHWERRSSSDHPSLNGAGNG